MNQIQRGQKELESLINRLKDSNGTNPGRERLAKSLEAILTHVSMVSGKINLWWDKREEQKQYYANKLSYEDIKNKKSQKMTFTNSLKNQVTLILLEVQQGGSQFIGA